MKKILLTFIGYAMVLNNAMADEHTVLRTGNDRIIIVQENSTDYGHCSGVGCVDGELYQRMFYNDYGYRHGHYYRGHAHYRFKHS